MASVPRHFSDIIACLCSFFAYSLGAFPGLAPDPARIAAIARVREIVESSTNASK